MGLARLGLSINGPVVDLAQRQGYQQSVVRLGRQFQDRISGANLNETGRKLIIGLRTLEQDDVDHVTARRIEVNPESGFLSKMEEVTYAEHEKAWQGTRVTVDKGQVKIVQRYQDPFTKREGVLSEQDYIVGRAIAEMNQSLEKNGRLVLVHPAGFIA